jgi:CRISPR-associated exonuclease Cas4
MDDRWVLLSEIEHWAYCPRQWAIIHLEQHFSDNELTTRGHLAHQRVDQPGSERRGEQNTSWALDVWSEQRQIRGRCDRVVFNDGAPTPIEHKSGRRALRAALVQLAGQALCLEDMFDTTISHGQLYLVTTNELQTVEITDDLRDEVTTTAQAIRHWRAGQQDRSPVAANDQRCLACSLNNACLPGLLAVPNRVRGLHGATWWP